GPARDFSPTGPRPHTANTRELESLELGRLRGSFQSQRGARPLRNELHDAIEVSRSHFVLMANGGISVRFRPMLGGLQLGIRLHSALTIVPGQFEHSMIQGM